MEVCLASERNWLTPIGRAALASDPVVPFPGIDGAGPAAIAGGAWVCWGLKGCKPFSS
jgi:hypothetical protein